MAPPYTLDWVHNLEKAPATSDARTVIVLAATFSIVSILSTLIRLYIRVVRRQFDEGEGYILLGTVSVFAISFRSRTTDHFLRSFSALHTVQLQSLVRHISMNLLQSGLC